MVIRFPRRCSPLPRGLSLSPRHLSKAERADAGAIEAEIQALLADRPRTRGDCLPGGKNEVRPCPFAGCRFHLFVDVRPAGSLRLNFPHLGAGDMEQMADTCALDVSDRGASEVNKIAELMNISPERCAQIAAGALQEMKAAGIRREAAAAERLYKIRRRYER